MRVGSPLVMKPLRPQYYLFKSQYQRERAKTRGEWDFRSRLTRPRSQKPRTRRHGPLDHLTMDQREATLLMESNKKAVTNAVICISTLALSLLNAVRTIEGICSSRP